MQWGTLFLDEIGDMFGGPAEQTAACIARKTIEGLVETKRHCGSCAVIAATHRNLEAMVAKGEFRAEFVLSAQWIHLHLPPLRERDAISKS